jgi:hypothetical protein
VDQFYDRRPPTAFAQPELNEIQAEMFASAVQAETPAAQWMSISGRVPLEVLRSQGQATDEEIAASRRLLEDPRLFTVCLQMYGVRGLKP